MKYFRIKAALKEYPDRFYRIVDIREDADLQALGIVLLTALGAEFEHTFMFKNGNISFVPMSWLDSPLSKDMAQYRISDLNESFMFIYDTGEDYIFDCERLSLVNKRGEKLAYLQDGKGQGIWEDNKESLLAYLAGEIDEENGPISFFSDYSLPWNYDNERFSDFDTDFDLDFEKEDFSLLAEAHLEDYLSEKSNDYGFSNISEEDLAKTKDAFVDMQINNFLLISDMLNELAMKYPNDDDEALMEKVREMLLKQADDLYEDFADYFSGADISKNIH